MVSADEEVLLQVVSPFGHGVDYAEPFLVENWVIALGLCKGSAEVVDWVPTVFVLLL